MAADQINGALHSIELASMRRLEEVVPTRAAGRSATCEGAREIVRQCTEEIIQVRGHEFNRNKLWTIRSNFN